MPIFPAGVYTTPRVIALLFLGGTMSSSCNLSGYRLPQAPKFSYSLGVTYRCNTSFGGFEPNANDGSMLPVSPFRAPTAIAVT